MGKYNRAMAISVHLDDIDITEDLNRQHKLPADLYDGVYPGDKRNQYYDLLPCIAAHEELKNNFFENDVGLHRLVIQDTSGAEHTVKLYLSMKYNSRNR